MNNPRYSQSSRPPAQGGDHAPSGPGSFLERLGAWRSSSGAAPQPHKPEPARRGRRLIIPVTRKGGVGKSFFLASLADWYGEQKIPFIAMDSDWCNGSLTRFVPEARFVDVASGNPAEEVHSALSECGIVALDGLGPLQGYLFEWLQDCNFFRDTGEPVELTYVLIVEEDKDSVFQAGESARTLGDTGQWLVVRNLKTCPTTEIYNTSDARQELLRLGAIEIQMDRVPWNLLLHVQRAGKTIGALAEDQGFPFLERQRMKSYLAKFYDQLGTAQSLLLPGGIILPPERQPEPPPPEPQPETQKKGRPRIAPDRV